ncbi:MAG: response regulator, partial [Deltaproteobacteria bacterium]|nr:response regulator [Deltaproteobacteria bacterium]
MEPNILIVDDQEDFLEAIMEELQTMTTEPIRINSCSNIYDAECHIKKNSPDIVVVDMNLPLTSGEDPEDGSGMQLVLYIRKIPKRTIIILITGETRLEAQDEYLNKGMNEGVNEIILKESRINYVDKLAERVIYLAGLLIKLNSSIGKEMGNTIITYGLHQHIISYFTHHIPKYPCKNITSVQDAINECEKQNICVCVVAVDNDDGYEFIRRFFNVRQDIPIVAITTQDDIQGFEDLKRARRDGAVFAVRYVKDGNYTEKIIQKALEYRKNKLDGYSN